MRDRPAWTNAAWPSAGHTDAGGRKTVRVVGVAVDDEEVSTYELSPAIAAPSTRPTTRALRIRSGWVMRRFKGPCCCADVSGFRYAHEMRGLVASRHACADRRGRALPGRS